MSNDNSRNEVSYLTTIDDDADNYDGSIVCVKSVSTAAAAATAESNRIFWRNVRTEKKKVQTESSLCIFVHVCKPIKPQRYVYPKKKLL